MKLKIGQTVYVRDEIGCYPGTVTQPGEQKVRILFPIRKFCWVFKECIRIKRPRRMK